jgi:hypothetical protein
MATDPTAVPLTIRGLATLDGVTSALVTRTIGIGAGEGGRRSGIVTPQRSDLRQRAGTALAQLATTRRRSSATTLVSTGALTLRGVATLGGVSSSVLTRTVTIASGSSARRSASASLPLLVVARRSSSTSPQGDALVIRGTATLGGVTSRVLTLSLRITGSTVRRAALASPIFPESAARRSATATTTALATIRAYADGAATPFATVLVAADGTFEIPLTALPTGTHTIRCTAQSPGDTESPPSATQTITILDEEEGTEMPAHAVNESTVTLSTANATRIDPSSPAAKRYMVRVLNTEAVNGNRVFIGYSSAVTTANGDVVEPDFGVRDFFIDSNVTLYAIRAGGTPSLRISEYVAA